MSRHAPASPGSTSHRSPSGTRRCSTSSACTSPGPCARSSRSTPTPAARPGRDLRRRGAPRAAARRRRGAARPGPVRPERPAPAGHGRRLGRETGGAGASFGGMLDVSSAVDTVYSPFEVACLDLRAASPAARSATSSAARCARRSPSAATSSTSGPGTPGDEPDDWGAALDPDQIVAQARRMVDGWGFGSLKLKGGVLPARRGVRRDRGPARRVPRPAAAARPERRLDRRDLAAGGRPPGRGHRVPRGPDPRHRGHGPRLGRDRRAARDQHVRHRVRAPPARRSRPTPCRSCSPTTTCGAACAAPRCWPGSPRPSAWACRCTATPTSASASRR